MLRNVPNLTWTKQGGQGLIQKRQLLEVARKADRNFPQTITDVQWVSIGNSQHSVYLSSAHFPPVNPILTSRKTAPLPSLVTFGSNPQKTRGVTAIPKRIVLPQWQFKPGAYNAITDVPGVRVGHVTIQKESPFRVRTGVTAIVPHQGNLATQAVWANGGWLNGNGELTGLGYLQETGFLVSPILLTNTYGVGKVYDAVFDYYQKHYPGQWAGLIPVVGECFDGFFNTIEARNAISKQDVIQAIEQAQSGFVPQGRVGAGTGMRSFELHAGMGSASRKVKINDKDYHIGVLVNANHSKLEQLNPVIREKLEKRYGSLKRLRTQENKEAIVRQNNLPVRQGSIMTVIATDLPLAPHQLRELITRAGLGLGAVGSSMDTTSGDGVIAFSTAQLIPLLPNAPKTLSMNVIHHDALSPVYRATIEAVTEAQINALVASHTNLS